MNTDEHSFWKSNLNLVPDGGVSYQLVKHLGYKKALEVYLNAEKIPADQCLEYGLINRVFSDEQFMDQVLHWADQLAQKQPLARQLGKQCMQFAMHNGLNAVVEFEANKQVICSQSPDTYKAIKAMFAHKSSTETA